METAWDNIDTGEGFTYVPHPLASVAERICKEKCPVRDLCVRDALTDGDVEGIRGGFRFHMGRVSSRDAYAIKREYDVKVSVIRRTGSYEPSNEVPGVSESD